MNLKRTFCFAFMCAAAPAPWLFAQSDTTIVMSGVTISDNRITIPFSEASRDIDIFEKSEISKLPAHSLPEVLSYVPGVDIRQRGPAGVQADIGIRGGSFEETLVLVNGIKLTDPQTGHHSLNVPIALDNLQRIEVLKGPGARLFGQNAFAGAINFVTRVPESTEINFGGYGGSFGSYGIHAGVSLPIGAYRQYVSVSRDASDGYRHNTDYGTNNIFYQSQADVGHGQLDVVAGLTDRQFGANGFYASPAYTEQYEEVRTSVVGVGYRRILDKMTISPRVYWRRNRDKYLLFRDDPGVYQNLHVTNVVGAELNGSMKSSLGTTGLGLEFRQEMISGDGLRGDVAIKTDLDSHSRQNFGLYAEQKFRLAHKLDVSPGVYVNWYSDYGWNAFPGIDLGYNVSPEIRIYANAGKSYRIPTYTDLYYKSPVEMGNKNLKPEEAATYEIGGRFVKNGISLEMNYFYRHASQLIDWVYNTNDSIWHAQNFGNINTNGVEFSASVDPSRFFGDGFPIDNIFVSYNFLDQNKFNEENLPSRYALEHIRNQVIAGLDLRVFKKLQNSLRARYIDREEESPYVLLDDRLSWQQNAHFSLYLEATNITDKQYTEVMTPMPGRWIKAGIKVNLDIGEKGE